MKTLPKGPVECLESLRKQGRKKMSEPLDKKVNTDAQNEFKEKIINAIKLVYDPEIPVDVYELSLIHI